MVISFLLLLLAFIAFWWLIADVFIALFALLCWLFGRSEQPPGVPNRAVWG